MGRYTAAGDDWEARCLCIFESMASHRSVSKGTISASMLRLGLDDMIAVYEIQVAVIHESFDILKAQRPGLTKAKLDEWLDAINPQQEMEALFSTNFGNINYCMSFEEYLKF